MRADLDASTIPVQDVMIPGVIICDLDDEAPEAAEWMHFRRVNRILAVDATMQPRGFLTLDAVERAQRTGEQAYGTVE